MTDLPNPESLRRLGWGLAQDAAFDPQARPDVWVGRVSRIDRGGWLTVETADGSQRARQHARFRRIMDPLEAPTVGDWVVLRHDAGGGPPVAEEVLPRRSIFVRNVGDDERAQPQPLAANIDNVLIVVSLDVPYNARRVDRFLSLTWSSGADPVMVLTKLDLVDDPDAVLADVREHAGEVDTVVLSARTGTGVDGLTPLLVPGRTLVLIGQSGAGKSTLANRLAEEDILAAKEVRSRDRKGRHTTTHRQLLRLPSGALLIDTPGLRSVGLWEASESLDDGVFADVDALASQCRFSDCAHDGEPGCAVGESLAAGTLSEERWRSYQTLRAEADHVTQSRMLAERAKRGGRRRR